MSSTPSIIYQSQDYRLDYYPGQHGAKTVVFTFTEHGNQVLDDQGFGGKFVLKNGSALVAVKSRTNRWYQDLPDEAITAANAFLNALPVPPERRAGYGSSMGAYAAIAFSGPLGFDDVLALSPLADISQDWDTRWAGDAEEIGGFKAIGPHGIRPGGRIVIAYDPVDLDRRHAEQISDACADGTVVRVPVPYAGHPAGRFLNQAGSLKTIAVSALSGLRIPDVQRQLRAARRRNLDYFFNLANHCLARRKLRWAESAIASALSHDPLNPEYNIRAAQVMEGAGLMNRAIMYAATAVAIWPDHPHMVANLARILERTGSVAPALHHINVALGYLPGAPSFRQFKEELERQSGGD